MRRDHLKGSGLRSCPAAAGLVSLLALVAMTFTACGGGDDGSTTATPDRGEPMKLDVLVYNIEYWGTTPPTL